MSEKLIHVLREQRNQVFDGLAMVEAKLMEAQEQIASLQKQLEESKHLPDAVEQTTGS